MTTTRTFPRVALAVVVTALTGILLATLLVGTSSAQKDPYGNGKPTVLPTRLDRDTSTPDGRETPDEEASVQGIRFSDDGPETLPAAEAEPGVLPFTGGEILPFLVAALGLIGAGFVLVRRRRSERAGA
jgi:hypothetical protein